MTSAIGGLLVGVVVWDKSGRFSQYTISVVYQVCSVVYTTDSTAQR